MSSRRREESLVFPVDAGSLEGDLVVPRGARGLVVFAHGSGSSRHSERNRFVAGALRGRGLATLLFDLLTPVEERRDAQDGGLRFDVPFLATRLRDVTDWVREDPQLRRLPLGYFGASTGAAAAIAAAAARPDVVRAVVSRGGRPDLAEDALARLRAPTLLIVGDGDTLVLRLNQSALRAISSPKRLAVVPGATHLFEEPGALDEVAGLAADWFGAHLVAGSEAEAGAGR